MRADPTDVDAKWDCASLYAELNDFPKAIDCLEQLLALRPGDVEICKMVAKVRLSLALRFSEYVVYLKMLKAKRSKCVLTFLRASCVCAVYLFCPRKDYPSFELPRGLGHQWSYFLRLCTAHSSWDVNMCLA